MDRTKVIQDIEECLFATCRGYKPRKLCPYNDDEWDIMRDALALIKEQEAVSDNIEKMFAKACETLAEFNPDFVCNDLSCDDAWCEEYCNAGGMSPECVKRWLEKQVEEDQEGRCSRE